MTAQFYFFSRLQYISSQIRRKDEIRLGAVLCGSDGCTGDEGCGFHRLHGVRSQNIVIYVNLHQLEISYYKLRKGCEKLGARSDGEILGSHCGVAEDSVVPIYQPNGL